MKPRTIIGLALIALGVVGNPWFLERFVVLDEAIDRKAGIFVVDAMLVLGGVALLLTSRGARAPRVPRKRHFAAIATGLAVVLSVGMAEIVLRFVVGLEHVLEGDALSEFHWRSRHSGGRGQAAGYAFDRFDPQLGWVPARNYKEGGIETNSMGIRARREYAFERVPGVRRIVVIGDSYTWGEDTWSGGISNEETFVALMESRLPDTEVINLGVHGWGTDQQLLYLRELGLRFKPDLVVLGFFEADMLRNTARFFNFSKPVFDLEQGKLVLTNVPIPESHQLLSRPFDAPSFFLGALMKKGLNAVLDRTKLRPIEDRKAWHLTRAIFEAIRRESEAAGARFLLVDIPLDVNPRASAIERAVASWANEAGVRRVLLREQFTSLPNAEWGLLYDGHFTARGHVEAAKAIVEEVNRAGLLPPARR